MCARTNRSAADPAADVTGPSEHKPRHGPACGDHSTVHGLITYLAARFLAVAPAAIDDTVVDSLRQIAELFQLDRALLWRNPADGSGDVASYSWAKHHQRPLPAPLALASLPFIASGLAAGEATWFTRIDEVTDPTDREVLLRYGLRSAAVFPVAPMGDTSRVQGALALGSVSTPHDWTPALIEQLQLVSTVFGQALARKASLEALQRALEEVGQLREQITEEAVHRHPKVTLLQPAVVRDRLHAENLYLRHEARERFGDEVIVGQGAAIRSALEQADQVAATDATVLLLGETGTGKDLIATHIHKLSARRNRVMVRVNCSAIPNTLMESELFGREKGAFTGALARQVGRFELADHSTIFLDEIGDLPADIQIKLLRVLEERQIERLGSPKTIPLNVRIIAATHRDLEKRISEDTFREDLFYRLNVFPIQVPPLRDRKEDIPLLVWRFVDEFSRSFGKRINAISRENMAELQQYAWPGNIREVRNVVERAMIVATGTHLTIATPKVSGTPEKSSDRFADVEREHFLRILESSGWRIRGSGGAADRLGLRPTTLETRMAKLGLSRPKPS